MAMEQTHWDSLELRIRNLIPGFASGMGNAALAAVKEIPDDVIKKMKDPSTGKNLMLESALAETIGDAMYADFVNVMGKWLGVNYSGYESMEDHQRDEVDELVSSRTGISRDYAKKLLRTTPVSEAFDTLIRTSAQNFERSAGRIAEARATRHENIPGLREQVKERFATLNIPEATNGVLIQTSDMIPEDLFEHYAAVTRGNVDGNYMQRYGLKAKRIIASP